ncbi:MAG: FMN-binding protein [Burkholderiales bacterium]|nr:FMN-binding protein [Burkholderiales bacterium]MDE2075466.1 FMN-binding protein [Burkholderiales bacterium]MDE2431220.1 FMN-binding protein [Burkholderiales bacterium]
MRIEILKVSALLPVALAAVGPTQAFAVDYMSPEQAQKALFPAADRFELKDIRLDAAQLQQMQQRYGIAPRSTSWKVWTAQQGNKPLGFVVIDNVIGKFELITYAVALQMDGSIKQIEILSYRESHGAEVRLPAWRQQFVGKGVQSTLKTGQDIANISGATLSCSHLTDGVKRIVSVIDWARSVGQLPKT